MNKLRIIVTVALLAVVAISGYFILAPSKNGGAFPTNPQQQNQISNPTQPDVPGAQVGTGGGLGENQGKVVVPSQPISSGNGGAGCKVGGCSGQLCLDASGEEIASTCEWKEEYSCYKKAKCEKQTTGKCGWTETAAFKQCLAEINPSL